MGPIVVFRIRTFPEPSETFIVKQIIFAKELGYEVVLLLDRWKGAENSALSKVVLEHHLEERYIELGNLRPTSKWVRFRAVLRILFSGMQIRLWKTLNPFRYGKKGLLGDYVLRYAEMGDLVRAPIYHIQFGTNADPLHVLKTVGAIDGRLITTFHGVDAHLMGLTNTLHQAKGDLLFKVGDVFTANTNFLRDRMVEIGCPQQRIQVVPMSIDTNFFFPLENKPESAVVRLIGVGRFIPLKGFHLLLEAVRILNQDNCPIELTLVGDGPERERLNDFVVHNDLSDRVHFAGQQNREQVRSLLRNSDIFVMSSVADGNGRRESQGVVTGEAQSTGLPVVGFRSGGVPDTVIEGETAFLAEEGRVQELALAIKRLVDQPDMRIEMGERARSFIEAYYSDRVVRDKWMDLYNGFLNSRACPNL